MRVRLGRQLALPIPPTRGGRRPGAGRKPNGARPGVSHAVRPWHDPAHPSHITLRALPGLVSLRAPHVFPAVREALRLGQRSSFRICEFSVQSNHLHLIVEAKDRRALSSGIHGLTIRVARAVNRALQRRGRVFADRYHRHDLATPREVRHAVHYVLNNASKHIPGFTGPDRCASAWPAARAVVAAPRTWLLRVGWRRATSLQSQKTSGGEPEHRLRSTASEGPFVSDATHADPCWKRHSPSISPSGSAESDRRG